jgi:spermidine synthase
MDTANEPASGGRLPPDAEIVEEASTAVGHIALRRVALPEGPHYELRVNGTYVMATYCRESEVALAARALELLDEASGKRVLIGGLGMGMTLAAALADRRVASTTVVEIEPLVVAWCRRYLQSYNAYALDDPRVSIVVSDIGAYIARTGERFDAILLDMDNGPDQPILPENVALYTDSGLDRWRDALVENGVLAIWAARPDLAFARRLADRFAHVAAYTVATNQTIGAPWPDVVYCARRRE